MADKAEASRVAGEVDEAEIDETDKADLTDNADVADKAIATIDAKLDDLDDVDKANEIIEAAKADDSNKAIKSEESDDADEVEEADEADEANESVGVFIELLLLLPFSLTKYSAIFAEVKESFEIYNNQLGGLTGGCLSPLSLMIRFVCRSERVFKNIWSKNCSLRSQCINQLERVDVNCG